MGNEIPHKDLMQWAWLAGLIDGEGSFFISINQTKTKKGNLCLTFRPCLAICLKYNPGCLFLLPEIAGNTKTYGERTTWSVTKRADLIMVTEKVLPFLRVKKEIAKRFLEALNSFPEKKGYKKYLGECGWSNTKARKILEIAYTLNPGSKNNLQEIDLLIEQLGGRYE